MQNNYLVIVCGYEGIEQIVGLFSREAAIEKVNAIRAVCGGDDKWEAKQNDYGEDYEAYSAARDAAMDACSEEAQEYWWTRPDQVCVLYVDGDGSKCVCSDLGVKPSEPWIY